MSAVLEESNLTVAPRISGWKSTKQGVYVVSVNGALTNDGARQFGLALFAVDDEQCIWEELAVRFPRIELDLDNTESIDSIGLRILIAILKRCQGANDQCKLSIVKASEIARRILYVSRLDQLFSA